jgi:hypothetical protein
MAETVDLNALIRLIPPARALKKDLEESIHTELYEGTGDMAVKSYNNLHSSVSRLIDDPYVESLVLDAPEKANDREKVLLARLASSQLVAYLEGQTGLVSQGGGSSGNSYYSAPVINGSISSVSNETLEKMIGLVKNPITEDEEKEQDENEQE